MFEVDFRQCRPITHPQKLVLAGCGPCVCSYRTEGTLERDLPTQGHGGFWWAGKEVRPRISKVVGQHPGSMSPSLQTPTPIPQRCSVSGTQPHSSPEPQGRRTDFTTGEATRSRGTLEHLTLTQVWGPRAWQASAGEGEWGGLGSPHISCSCHPVEKLS